VKADVGQNFSRSASAQMNVSEQFEAATALLSGEEILLRVRQETSDP
jgi:hypothetical protein